MTSPGQYGSHQYQSPETRALASITAESYDKDQAKTLIKLKNDVGYMAAYMRKMQKSIDQANENFIQQIQSFIADFIVLLGGGSLTTIDFGDLRYVIQAIGALLGFQTVAGIPIPINLFTAAWNFFGIYIAPTQQFADVINEFIDAGFAIIIDALGEIPVLGNAIEQLAAWLIEIRDALWPLIDTVFLLIDTLSGQPGTEADDVMGGLFQQIIDMLLLAPEALMSVLTALIDLLLETPQILLNLLNGLISLLIDSPDTLIPLLNKLIETLLTLPGLLETLLVGLIELLLTLPNNLQQLLEALINMLVTIPEILETLIVGFIDLLVNLPETLVQLLSSLIGLLVISPEILAELIEAIFGADGTFETIVEGIEGLLGIDLGNVQSLEEIGQALLDSTTWLEGLANSVTEFLDIPTGGIPDFVPISHMGLGTPNLLENPLYDDAGSVDGATDWFHDATQFHAPALGSVYTLMDMARPPLYSKPVVKVAEDQVLHFSHWVKWSGLVGTPTSTVFTLGVATYFNKSVVSQVPVATITNPAASSGWTELAGDYTIPPGVDEARMYLQVVRGGVTAGTVHWSDAEFTKTQLLKMDWVAGLLNAFTQAANNLQALADLIAGKVSAIPDDITNRLKNIKTDGTGLLDISKVFNQAPIAAIPTNLLTVANVPDLGSVTDQLTNSLIGAGSQFVGTVPTQARLSMDRIYNDVMNLTQKMQDIRSGETAQNVTGTSYSVNFQNYPDGNMPADWTVTYSGAGTSTIGVTSGKAGWRSRVNNGNRNAKIVQNTVPSKTDFQIIRGTLANAPAAGGDGGVPKIWSMARVDNPANPQNYVWCRGYCTGFLTYKGDMGCTVNGVDTVWVSGIPLTWSMDIAIIVGVGGNPRRYQVFSGTQLVYDYTEVGTVSKINNGTTDPPTLYRWWGALSEIRTDSGGAIAVADVAGTAMSDNQPPNVVGSGAKMSRTSSTAFNFPSGGPTLLGNSFFNSPDYQSDDIVVDTVTGKFTTTLPGWYVISASLWLSSLQGTELGIFLYKNGALHMAGSEFHKPIEMHGSWVVYSDGNDYFQLGTHSNYGSGNWLDGESTGARSYFSIGLLNRSLA